MQPRTSVIPGYRLPARERFCDPRRGAVVVGTGRVGRTKVLALEERAALAARATIRHCFTDYDDRVAVLDPFEAELDDFEYRMIKHGAHEAVDDFLCAHRQLPARA